MTTRERIRFYQQLAVLARAGVPLRTSLQRLENRFSGREVSILSAEINQGRTVGEAFAAAHFSPFECSLVNAGERSAHLDEVFQHLADFWTRQAEMMSAIYSQAAYPLVVLHLTVLVGGLVNYAQGVAAVVVSIVVNLAWLYAVGFVLFMLVKVSWSSDAAQRFWLALPMIGRTLSTAYAYRWVTALRMEYTAGVPMPDAAADAWRASGFADRERLAAEAYASLREGTELSTLVQHWRVLPRDWIDFIETGEVSGALQTALENLDAEAGRAWSAAQARMNYWVPKMIYFVIIVVSGMQIFTAAYKLIVTPISEATGAVTSILNK